MFPYRNFHPSWDFLTTETPTWGQYVECGNDQIVRILAAFDPATGLGKLTLQLRKSGSLKVLATRCIDDVPEQDLEQFIQLKVPKQKVSGQTFFDVFQYQRLLPEPVISFRLIEPLIDISGHVDPKAHDAWL